MTVPSIDMLLIAGRAVFLVFSFVFAAVAFTAWRRATQQQTEHLLSHTDLVLQRLAHLEARVDATKLTSFRARRPPGAPGRGRRHAQAPAARLPAGHPPRQGRRVARGVDGRLRAVADRGGVGAAPARLLLSGASQTRKSGCCVCTHSELRQFSVMPAQGAARQADSPSGTEQAAISGTPFHEKTQARDGESRTTRACAKPHLRSAEAAPMRRTRGTASALSCRRVRPLRRLHGRRERRAEVRPAAKLLREPTSVTLDIASVQRIDTAGIQLIAAFVREREVARPAGPVARPAPAFTSAARLLGVASVLRLPEQPS